MVTIAMIIMVAVVLEGLVEYGKTIMNMVEAREYKTAITQAITIILGIGLAFGFGLQLFNKGLTEIYPDLHISETLDMILTGIIFSRGSNYTSDLIKKLSTRDQQDLVDDDEDEEDWDEDQDMLMEDASDEEEEE